MLLGCSELNETARLVDELLGLPASAYRNRDPFPVARRTGEPAPPPAPERGLDQMPQLSFRGDRLEYILASLCRRGGFIGAVVADGKGLPLADFNSPVGGGTLAAFTSVLGNALERAGDLLGEHGANALAMDINYTDKVVLRSFDLEGKPYLLLVICSQALDERAEVELSIEQITAVLTES